MPAFIDKTGQKFGEITVLSYSHHEDGKHWWNTQCSCGSIAARRGGDLGKQTTQCEHCGRKQMKPKFIGQRFGNAIATSYHSKGKYHYVCDCGKTGVTKAETLKKGNPCGCVSRFKDLTGQRFGKLVVQKLNGVNDLGKRTWECLCDCGNTSYPTTGSLTTGNTASCGCNSGGFIHGGTGKSSYNSWKAMMARCYHSQSKDYKYWGARGITVCDRWHDYLNFVADMGEPIGTETLDRINNDGNYELINCRWATPSMQNSNQRKRA